MNNRIAFIDFQKPYRTRGRLEPEAPLGFLFLSGAVKAAGFQTRLFSYWKGTHDLRKIIDELVEYNPRVLAVNGTFAVFAGDLVDMLAKIRPRLPEAVTIIGGIAATVTPELYLGQEAFDYVCLGEGEVAFTRFCEAVCDGKEPEGIAGICGSEGEGAERYSEIQALGDLADVDLDLDLVDWRDYLKKTRTENCVYSIQTSRGCPFACRFCYRSSVRVKYRVFPVEKVISWSRHIKARTNCDSLRVIDDHFFVDQKRARRIIKGLRDIGISLCALDLRMENVSDDLFEFLQNNRVDSVTVGLESCFDHILKRMDKRTTRAGIERASQVIRKWDRVKVRSQLMLATPGMTDDELFGSIDWAIEKLKDVPNWYILFTVFFPLPGSLFHKEIIRDYPQYGFGALSDLDKIGTKHVSGLEWSGISEKYRKKLYRMRVFFKFYGLLYRASLRWRLPFARLYLRFLEVRLRKLKLLNCGFERWLAFRLFGMLKRLRIIRADIHGDAPEGS